MTHSVWRTPSSQGLASRPTGQPCASVFSKSTNTTTLYAWWDASVAAWPLAVTQHGKCMSCLQIATDSAACCKAALRIQLPGGTECVQTSHCTPQSTPTFPVTATFQLTCDAQSLCHACKFSGGFNLHVLQMHQLVYPRLVLIMPLRRSE